MSELIKDQIQTIEGAPKKNTRVKKIVAGAAAAGLLAASAAIVVHYRDKKAESHKIYLDAASEAVAHRTTCSIVGVADTGEKPDSNTPIGTRDGKPRTTVILRLLFGRNPMATEPMARFADDDTIIWLVPDHVRTTLSDDATRLDDRTPLESDSIPVYDNTTTADGNLYPRTDYQPGTEADVYITGEVITFDTDDSATKRHGYEPCGTIEFDGQQWVQDSSPTNLRPATYQEQLTFN